MASEQWSRQGVLGTRPTAGSPSEPAERPLAAACRPSLRPPASALVPSAIPIQYKFLLLSFSTPHTQAAGAPGNWHLLPPDQGLPKGPAAPGEDADLPRREPQAVVLWSSCHSPDSGAGPGHQTRLRAGPGWKGSLRTDPEEPPTHGQRQPAVGSWGQRVGGWLGQTAPKGSEEDSRTSFLLSSGNPRTSQQEDATRVPATLCP